MGGVERGQRNVGAINLYKIAAALGMSLSKLFAEVEGTGEGGRRLACLPELPDDAEDDLPLAPADAVSRGLSRA